MCLLCPRFAVGVIALLLATAPATSGGTETATQARPGRPVPRKTLPRRSLGARWGLLPRLSFGVLKQTIGFLKTIAPGARTGPGGRRRQGRRSDPCCFARRMWR
jgi:hypothetical protein